MIDDDLLTKIYQDRKSDFEDMLDKTLGLGYDVIENVVIENGNSVVTISYLSNNKIIKSTFKCNRFNGIFWI